MLECFDNYIGIRGYCRDGDNPPYSGLYINDLPGFTADDLGNVANLDEVETHEQLFKQKLNLAFALLKEDFFIELNSRYKVRAASVTETKKIGFFQSLEDNKFNDLSNIQRGIVLENRVHKSRKLARLKLTEVSIWANQEVDTFISIIDGNDITNIPVRTNPYEPVVLNVDYFLKTEQIFIVLDNSFSETYKSTVYPSTNHNLYNSCLSQCCDRSCNDFYMFGWDGNNRDFNTFGLSASAILYCDYDALWCSLKDVLALPLLYKTGFLIMEEAVFGTRANFVRSSSGEETYLPYLEDKYKKYLNSAVMQSEQICKRIDSCCMPCKGAKVVLHGV